LLDPNPTHRLSLEKIARSAASIDPVFLHAPQYVSAGLSRALGSEVTLKIETVNPIGSFKGRGASFFVQEVVSSGRVRPMVCASAGNFGQALAYACRSQGLPLTVFASVNANTLKVARMRMLGADVRLEGEDFDAAKHAARRWANDHGAWMVEDGREAEISEGAGSIGVELLAHGAAYDALLLPLGNGALLTGVARWVKAHAPATRIYGVSSVHAPAMHDSWRLGRVVEYAEAPTIADGIAVRVPIPEAVSDMQGIVDDVLLVEDDSILAAMRLLFDEERIVAEPAGAAGVAALLQHTALGRHQRVATAICGSNMTPEQMRERLLA
jgi:threonine dehydratase